MVRFFFLYLIVFVGCNSRPGENRPPVAVHVSSVGGADTLSVRYVGNMGVLLTVDTSSVIIDGLHKPYLAEYLPPPEELVDEILESDELRLTALLVTHMHGDHFDADYTLRYLEVNPTGIVVGPEQIKETVAAIESRDAMLDRIMVAPTEDGNNQAAFENAGVGFTTHNCRHESAARHSATQNVCHIVRLGDFRVLHAGDSSWETIREALEGEASAQEIDVAVLPYWILRDSAQEIWQVLAPRHIIATHVPVDDARVVAGLERLRPSVTVFSRLGDELQVSR